MTTGTVTFFDVEAGCGVISSEQGHDVFVRAANIQSETHKTLDVGQKVEFDTASGRQGDEARNVRDAIDPGAAASLITAIRLQRSRLPRMRSGGPGVLSAGSDPRDGVARQEGRGFVASYGQGRLCAEGGCPTTLSRYNRHSVCWLHSPRGGGRVR